MNMPRLLCLLDLKKNNSPTPDLQLSIICVWLLVGATLLTLGCPASQTENTDETNSSHQVVSTPTPPADASSDPNTTATKPGAAENSTSIPAVAVALQDIKIKQKCNQVMGCKPQEQLVEVGSKAVPDILQALKTGNRTLPYFGYLVETLGLIKDPSATATLENLLETGGWTVRTQAAISLGRIGAKSAIGKLQKVADAPPSEMDLASRAGATYALARLGEAKRREDLAAMVTPESVRKENWGFMKITIDLVGELELHEALPGIRLAAGHKDFFMRRTAVRSLIKMEDKQAIQILVRLLSDPIPSIRREAKAGLVEITKQRFENEEEWKTWCKTHSCGPIPSESQ